jgi:hypothetical protein
MQHDSHNLKMFVPLQARSLHAEKSYVTRAREDTLELGAKTTTMTYLVERALIFHNNKAQV